MFKNHISFDIDLDTAHRDTILTHITHRDASIIKNGELIRHNTGIYVQDIPYDEYTGLATYDYKEAERLGYLKIDILNVGVYENVRNEKHLDALMSKEPNWKRLEDIAFCQQVIHVNNHCGLIREMRPSSIKEMAMFLAIIRPGKKYLIGKSWKEIEKEVWIKPENETYYFKRSHSVSYSVLVGVHMNLLEEQGV